jgi:hypothetical protein
MNVQLCALTNLNSREPVDASACEITGQLGTPAASFLFATSAAFRLTRVADNVNSEPGSVRAEIRHP